MRLSRTGQACKYFQEASKIADATGNRQNQHEARFGLALARLYADDLGAAGEAIDGARQYDYPQNTAAAWTATGIIRLRQGEPVAASKAFACGLAEADGLLELCGQTSRPWTLRVWPCVGLRSARMKVTDRRRGGLQGSPQITQAKGVVARVLSQFDALALTDMDGILPTVRKAAEGQ